MNSHPDPDSLPPELLPRLRTARTVGAALWACLLLQLAAVEVVRAAARPFFGLARLAGGRIPVRYGVYLGAAAIILAIRIINGRQAGRKLFPVAIASLALAALPAVLGLVLFLLGGYNRDFYALFFVSMLLMFMYFPRASVWQARRTESGRTCPF
jgi:hypothetical protein